MLLQSLKEKARHFRAKKRLGQNFLINPEILSKIVRAFELKENDHVLEIGPGLGFLSQLLVEAGARLTAIEVDSECVKKLRALSLPRMELIQSDFLDSDLSALLSEKTKVIGNIPYNITSPIIAKLLGEIGKPSPWLGAIDSIILTVQREVASRLVALPGGEDYSQITLLINYFAQAELLFLIEPEDFYPIPEVTSAVVRLVPYATPPVSCLNTKLLRQLIRSGFRQRRKMLRNNLGFLKISPDKLLEVFAELNFDPQVRAERLGLKQFALLADALVSSSH
jgi:16S rRNA (adenine1518-N6/adenine1519-N6)-dimethyltransferase